VLIWTFTTRYPIYPKVPGIILEYPSTPYNESKVALLIENRPQTVLAPLLLHMISVVPEDWKFRFMGSDDSISLLVRSAAIRHQVALGKLDVSYIPEHMNTDGQEAISQVLTDLWFYQTLLAPAEWLLIFQTDSILCANSIKDLNDWLDYDWVGAPWVEDSTYGGNGGLSLRKVSAIINILQHQERLPNTDPEDVWLSKRLGHRPKAVLANGTISSGFSSELFHHAEPPMGYHIGGSGGFLHPGIWGSAEHRQEVYNYCPEIKMELVMDTAVTIKADCDKVHTQQSELEQLKAELEARRNGTFNTHKEISNMNLTEVKSEIQKEELKESQHGGVANYAPQESLQEADRLERAAESEVKAWSAEDVKINEGKGEIRADEELKLTEGLQRNSRHQSLQKEQRS